MRDKLIHGQPPDSRAETVAYSLLGMAGVVAILLAISSISDSASKWDQAGIVAPPIAPATIQLVANPPSAAAMPAGSTPAVCAQYASGIGSTATAPVRPDPAAVRHKVEAGCHRFVSRRERIRHRAP